eukprot:TRINITY_DN10426_c0_g1_i2.p1 TRINITY_DN10426_c0_g1~~TRINITY_DN10426_c0_g1_i2.p1  ORF type:complete len:392 (+),score=88.00 TRINITY_DN10426_c0_g1_i2:102-1277(+)
MIPDKIEVQLSGRTGLVWSHESVVRLRRDHRILGGLVGSGARFPREEPGLPLLLSQQEMHVLLKEDAIRLVFIPRLVLPPSQEIKEKADKYDEDSYQQQIQVFKKEKEANIRSFADRILEGKKKKMMKKLKKQKVDDSEDPEIPELDRDAVIEEEIAKIQPITKDHQILQIFTKDPWLEESDKIEAKLSQPTEPLDKCRLLAFQALWEKGYFIGEGSKFGGDYLVYLGDPLKFHASYIVICQGIDSLEKERPQDLVAKSRLGSQVNKTVLVAQLMKNKDEVTFTSVRRNHAKRQVKYFLTTEEENNEEEYHEDDDTKMNEYKQELHDPDENQIKEENTEEFDDPEIKSEQETENSEDMGTSENQDSKAVDEPLKDEDEESSEVEEGFEDEL